jgi:hydrogenase-4 component B
MISAIALQMSCVAALLTLAVAAVVLSRSKQATGAIYGTTLIVSAVATVASISWLVRGEPEASAIILPVGLPWLGAHFRLDKLASFFLAVINFGGAIASLYGFGYGRHDAAPHRVLPFYPAYLAGMNLVLLADDAFSFLVGWEFMSLTSWALVLSHHRDPENVRAGSKAGLLPLHAWLPLAHPAAPSHVSALMSGVMTKVAVYGFVRVVFDLVGALQWWWSVPLLTLGATSAVIGLLSALLQGDLKRLLVYSTIENIGIVFVGLGLALAFKANEMPAAAALAMTGALFHVLNHSIFKSLLFFGSGAVLTATGERDIEKLGGLIHGMPLTAFTFLVGCVAISALPPLNGFVSEWLVFQAVLLSPELPQWGLKLLVPASARCWRWRRRSPRPALSGRSA